VVEKLLRFRAVRLGRSAMGERLGNFTFGTIIVLAAVVAGAKADLHDAGKIAALVAGTSVVSGSHTSWARPRTYRRPRRTSLTRRACCFDPESRVGSAVASQRSRGWVEAAHWSARVERLVCVSRNRLA
jgi:hypothetical protein